MNDITDEPGGAGLTPRGLEPVSIEQEMRKSYLDYAMSVIVSRALPDVRDGLKPVHRRILYRDERGRQHAGQAVPQIRAHDR